MHICKKYYKNIIEPLEAKYTNVDNKLKTIKWYKLKRRYIYKKLKKLLKNNLDKHNSFYADFILFEIFNYELSEEEEKKVNEMTTNAFKKLNLHIDNQTYNN